MSDIEFLRRQRKKKVTSMPGKINREKKKTICDDYLSDDISDIGIQNLTSLP